MPDIPGISKLWDWGCKVAEAWPAVKASFQGEMESPWKETVEIGTKPASKSQAREAAGQAAQGVFQFLFGPDTVYRSDIGRSLLHGIPGGKDLGLLGADAETKLQNDLFIKNNELFLQKIDPLWKHEDKAIGKTFDQGIADTFGDYLRGKVKTDELPVEWRNEAAGVKQWIIDRYNKTDAFVNLSPGKQKGNWVLDDDVISPTVKVFKEEANAGQYGLVHIVPKEIPYKILRDGNADGVSGVDWLRMAAPMVNRKHQFDPVIDRMRSAMGSMNKIEADYTERLLNRLTGRPTKLQETIDGVVNNVRFAFGAPALQVSPSARFAAGMSKLFYDGIMLYNPGMALLNMTQTLNTLAKEGEMTTLKGIKNFMTKEGQELAGERKFLGDLDYSFYRATDKGKLGQGLEKFEHWGYKLFDKAEHYNRGIAFHAGLVRFMRENGIKSLDDFLEMRGSETFEKGMLAGLEASNESQFLYGVVNQSPYLSSPLAKLIGGQFMSFPLRQSEFIIKQLRQKNALFLPRFIAYTGAASMAAYYGMGLAIGENLGGGGSWPESYELLKQGKTSDAIWTSTAGLFKFLPETQSLAQGVTPFGNMIVNGGAALMDTLGILSTDNPEAKWARVGRSMMLALPAGLELRRVLEAGMVQFGQEGKRYRPEGLGEGLSLPVALSAASKKVFGSELPGISTRYTGSLQREETPMESLKAAAGLRGSEIEMESRIMDINSAESKDVSNQMSGYSKRIAQALITNAPPEEFSAAVEAAVNSGLFPDPASLHQSISNAMRQRTMSDLEREGRRAPKAVKVQRAINAP